MTCQVGNPRPPFWVTVRSVNVTQTVIAATTDGTHWAAILGVVVTVVLVGVTAVLVWINGRQMRLTREALELTRDAVVATQKEADATAAAVQVAQEQLAASTEVTREAMRARVDQQSPRVVVRAIERDPHVWYPSTVGGDPNPATTGQQIQFQVPRQDDQPLFVRVDLHLRNEGTSSGWVSCSTVEFLAWPSASTARASFTFPKGEQSDLYFAVVSAQQGMQLPPYLRPRAPDSMLIGAGEDPEWVVRVELECPLGEWVKASPVEAEMTIVVKDAQDPGVEDEIPVTVTAAPFARDASNAGLIVVRQGTMDQPADPPLVDCVVMRRRRRYQGEAP